MLSDGNNTKRGNATAVVGLQWGDEGKGKVVDILAREHDAIVRFNGGANAGHSVVVGGTRYALHLVPSGILYPGKAAVIGNGVVVDPWKLVEELDGLAAKGVDVSGLVLSSRAHVVLPYHKLEDVMREQVLAGSGGGGGKIGTTGRGIGPAYADKMLRGGAVRVGDLLRPEVLREKLAIAVGIKGRLLSGAAQGDELDVEAIARKCGAIGERLAPCIKDTVQLLHGMLAQNKRLLFEGANATLLDVDHGTYPYVTSSSCTTAGVGVGAGVPVTRLSRVVGVMKAYTTRVGAGPMPTELHDDRATRIRERGREYGTTTGRPRRVGWVDLVAARYSVMVNGVTSVAMTMLDVLSGMDELCACVAYEVDGERVEHFLPDAADLGRVKPVFVTLPGFAEDIAGARKRGELPAAARRFVEFVQERIGAPIEVVSVGPGREQTMVDGL